MKGLTPGETYTLRETVAPEGYEITTDTTFTLDENGDIDREKTTTTISEEGVLLVEDAKSAPTPTPEAGKTIRISKVDITDQSELEGAHIQILDKDGNVVEEWVSAKEPHEVTGLTPGETYTLRETVAPDGYTVTTDTTFTLDENGNIDAENTTTTVSEDGILLIEDTATSVTIEKVDAETKDPLEGAVLRVEDAEGTVIDKWTTDGTPHVISGRLNVGETYILVEESAPEGYHIADPITFVVTAVSENNIIVMEDQKRGPESASIKVTKELTLDDEFINAVDQTFYVALYEDAECTKPVSDIKAIEFKNASASTVEFTGLEVGRTYYIRETNASGEPVEVGALEDGTVFMSYFPNGNEAVVTEENGVTTVIFQNQFYDLPDGFYIEGVLNVSKNVVGTDGTALNSNEVFYAGIFDDPGYTIPSQYVTYNMLELNMNGGSSASSSTAIAIPSMNDSVTLYITEVDEDGTPVAGAKDFKYTVSQDKTYITVSAANANANVSITNIEKVKKETTTTISADDAKTGDDTPIGLYLALLAASVTYLTSAVYRRRRRRMK